MRRVKERDKVNKEGVEVLVLPVLLMFMLMGYVELVKQKWMVQLAAIGCDKCEVVYVWSHNSEMCAGLPLDILQAIEQFQGSGIQFICMK